MRLFHSAAIFCCYICTCICCLKLRQADHQVGEGFFTSILVRALSSNVFTICAVYWSLGRRGYFSISNVVLVNCTHGNELQWNRNRNWYILFKKRHLKMSGKWRPFCLGLNELSTHSDKIFVHATSISILCILAYRIYSMRGNTSEYTGHMADHGSLSCYFWKSIGSLMILPWNNGLWWLVKYLIYMQLA